MEREQEATAGVQDEKNFFVQVNVEYTVPVILKTTAKSLGEAFSTLLAKGIGLNGAMTLSEEAAMASENLVLDVDKSPAVEYDPAENR